VVLHSGRLIFGLAANFLAAAALQKFGGLASAYFQLIMGARSA